MDAVSVEGLLPEEVEWEGGELLKQIEVSQSRVDGLRGALSDVASQVARIRDNQDLIERQRVLLQGQHEAMDDVKGLASRVQQDNETLRIEFAQMKRLREQSAEQQAAAAQVEQRHRKQLESQASLVANVRQDLMALSAENAELRRQASKSKKLQADVDQCKQKKHDSDRAAHDEQLALKREISDLREEHLRSIVAEREKNKKLLKEQRFKLLRAQQQQSNYEAEQAQTTALLASQAQELAELKQKLADLTEVIRDKTHEVELLKAKDTELHKLMDQQQEMFKQHPNVVDQDLLRQREAEISGLRKKVEEATAEQRMAQIDMSNKDLAREEEVRKACLRADDLSAELDRLRDHAQGNGERADALAAQLAIAEASLLAKDELLRTRTERLRFLTASGGGKQQADGHASPTRELHLESELESYKVKFSSLESSTKMQLDKAGRDRAVLQAKVEELTKRLEELLD
ncbi:Flagellar attachment zone protein 1 [Diplonema papillatum]|nr:Flagellar attachment zone protein 1 [Diplonema papillatum]